MKKKYDIIIIGSGPGGYTAAIRGAQLGMKICIIEKKSLGGTCLNWGCIPTKTLINNANILKYIKNSKFYGIKITKNNINFKKIIQKSKNIIKNIQKGIKLLLKKNNINIIYGHGEIKNNKTVKLKNKNQEFNTNNIIIATGSRNKEIPNIKIDNKQIIGYKKAMSLSYIPKSIIIIGGGSIGIEFCYFYSLMGSKITIIECMKNILPKEDEEISKYLQKYLEKKKIKIYTNAKIKNFKKKKKCEITIEINKKYKTIESDIILSAIGIKSNIEDIGIEKLKIKKKNDKIITNKFYQTNISQIYAIGDIINTPSLAHVASAEGIACIEKISGINIKKINYNYIPNCIYSYPEIASIGYKKKIKNSKIGKFFFKYSGKAITSNKKDGFIKIIIDNKYGEILGAHIIGNNITEIISEIIIAKKFKITAYEIIKTIHPHPTMSESIIEALNNAYNK